MPPSHHNGLIHRDVKPSNILLDRNVGRHDFVYLADFGITRLASGDSQSLTSTHALVGSLDYMAPEQFEGSIGIEVDIYSLGCVFFQCLTGSKPFPVEGLPALMRAHMTLDPPVPSQRRPEVGVGFDKVIKKALAKDPFQRHGGLVHRAVPAPRPR
jgi:serine/threonine-protein kinase